MKAIKKHDLLEVNFYNYLERRPHWDVFWTELKFYWERANVHGEWCPGGGGLAT